MDITIDNIRYSYTKLYRNGDCIAKTCNSMDVSFTINNKINCGMTIETSRDMNKEELIQYIRETILGGQNED